jgi:hypothetical protein
VTNREPHPDFTAAPEDNQWTLPLEHLGTALRHEAYEKKGEWAWRILPGGALVAMRLPPTFRKELRVARRLRRAFTDQSAKAWHTELNVFLEHLGCTGWTCLKDALAGVGPEADTQVTVEAIYQEPAPLGATKAVLLCARCGQQFEPHPDDKLYREPICNPCAIKAGEEETAANRAARNP